jgi:hypothetical protein
MKERADKEQMERFTPSSFPRISRPRQVVVAISGKESITSNGQQMLYIESDHVQMIDRRRRSAER